MAIKQIWTEKYRPRTAADYVFVDSAVEAQVKHWIKTRSIPNLLFYGPAGTGKTTLAKVILNELDIDPSDIMFANGSKEGRKIEWVDRLIGFCQTMPFTIGGFKVVVIDEADYLNKDSVQPAMRNLMEEYSDSVRFILTCNYANRIIPPLKSRCQEIHIDKTDKEQFALRTINILTAEKIEFDPEDLMTYIDATYPDLRKCLNLLQPNSITGALASPKNDNNTVQDYRLDAVALFKQKQYRKARELICSQLRPDEMEDFFRWSYDNLDLWSSTPEGQDQAVVAIRNAIVAHASCGDHEINLSAMLIELTNIKD
jgi:DNA polymerase III delta prime subunit